MTKLVAPPERVVERISQEEVAGALYGILRLVAGYSEWQKTEGVDEKERSQRLIEQTLKEITEGNSYAIYKDSKALSAYTRKLKAYQQIQLLETFCMHEVDWTD